MVRYALNIEDLASQDELSVHARTNVKLHGRMDSYWFHYLEKDLPENYEEMSLCLVPMKKYVPDKINFEDDCIFAQIDKVENNTIYFEKKFPYVKAAFGMVNSRTIDLKVEYFVRFIPNRITYRACFHAFDTIRMRLLSKFFSDFDTPPAINDEVSSHNNRIIEFDWYNKSIATNEEQKQAIKNIVNRTSFPFPYVVHGPPGKYFSRFINYSLFILFLIYQELEKLP